VARLGAPRLVTLADPVATETDLAITLRSDPVAGATWLVGPATTAAWIVDGCYRFDTPAGSITLGEGEFISIENAAQTWAVSLTPSSRALLLRL
jgi:hypothetical protein